MYFGVGGKVVPLMKKGLKVTSLADFWFLPASPESSG